MAMLVSQLMTIVEEAHPSSDEQKRTAIWTIVVELTRTTSSLHATALSTEVNVCLARLAPGEIQGEATAETWTLKTGVVADVEEVDHTPLATVAANRHEDKVDRHAARGKTLGQCAVVTVAVRIVVVIIAIATKDHIHKFM